MTKKSLVFRCFINYTYIKLYQKSLKSRRILFSLVLRRITKTHYMRNYKQTVTSPLVEVS